MAISRKHLNDILDQLSEEHIKLVAEFAEMLMEQEKSSNDFEEAYDYGVKRYNKALERLNDDDVWL